MMIFEDIVTDCSARSLDKVMKGDWFIICGRDHNIIGQGPYFVVSAKYEVEYMIENVITHERIIAWDTTDVEIIKSATVRIK